MNTQNESNRGRGNDRLTKHSDFTLTNSATSSERSLQDLPELDSQFDRVEISFSAIASQHKLPHRRLLALNWAARYHGIPNGTFQKAFEMWLESNTAGGER